MNLTFIPKETVLEKEANNEHFKLVEVLGEKQYNQGHIPGAINIPLDQLKEQAPEELDKEEPIIVYCASYTCQASTKAARILQELGYTNVLDYKGSKRDWKQAGLPLETSDGEEKRDAEADKEHETTCKFC